MRPAPAACTNQAAACTFAAEPGSAMAPARIDHAGRALHRCGFLSPLQPVESLYGVIVRSLNSPGVTVIPPGSETPLGGTGCCGAAIFTLTSVDRPNRPACGSWSITLTTQ